MHKQAFNKDQAKQRKTQQASGKCLLTEYMCWATGQGMQAAGSEQDARKTWVGWRQRRRQDRGCKEREKAEETTNGTRTRKSERERESRGVSIP
jgi:hypothetical protein